MEKRPYEIFRMPPERGYVMVRIVAETPEGKEKGKAGRESGGISGTGGAPSPFPDKEVIQPQKQAVLNGR